MKGLIISFIAVVLCIAGSAIMAQLLRPQRHLKLFVACSLVGAAGYAAMFATTPPDVWFLTEEWQCGSTVLDFFYGLAVYVLNCHTWIDVFFATCGGFSSAILLVMRKAGTPVSTDEVTSAFTFAEDGGERIYSARFPNLIRWGYITCESASSRMRLTSKGRAVALIVRQIKTLLSLKAGG
ncbi:MAG: hypothetical protein NTW36_03190 [Planctomycetia bacterium]|nr:hypothetical protein [Planctomycetia bacterium]